MLRTRRVLFVYLFGLLAEFPVQADLFDTQASFLAALPAGTSTVVETFDGIGALPPSPLLLPGFSASAAGGFYTITSGTDIWLSTNVATDSIDFTFSTPVMGAGGFFFPTDILGQVIPGTVEVVFVASDGGAFRAQVDAGPTTFLGYIPDFGGVTGLSIRSLQNAGVPEGTFVTVNDLTVAQVPEPSSAALLGIGILLLGLHHVKRTRLGELRAPRTTR